jgi:hypothetical protein
MSNHVCIHTGFAGGYICDVEETLRNSVGRVLDVLQRQLVVQAKHYCVIDTSTSDKSQRAAVIPRQTCGFGAGVNLGMKGTLQTLCAQIRAAMKAAKKRGGTTARQIFMQFDTDCNGIVDKDELLIGCRDMGIPITKEDVETLW